ncbi:MAG: hypothetical protein JO250_10260 [Armatimonadetes bacterium]|nr:hypothetical protein [Armatimonadota bacterium]
MRQVQIQIQMLNVSPEELAKAEQRAGFPQPVALTDAALRLKTGLAGAEAERLYGALVRDDVTAMRLWAPFTTREHLTAMFEFMEAVPPSAAGAGQITMASPTPRTLVNVVPSINSDGTVTLVTRLTRLRSFHAAAPGMPENLDETHASVCIVPSGKFVILDLPPPAAPTSAADQAGVPTRDTWRLLLVTATIVSTGELFSGQSAPYRQDGVCVSPPDTGDQMGITSPPIKMPVVPNPFGWRSD